VFCKPGIFTGMAGEGTVLVEIISAGYTGNAEINPPPKATIIGSNDFRIAVNKLFIGTAAACATDVIQAGKPLRELAPLRLKLPFAERFEFGALFHNAASRKDVSQ
jgi:hypothetical protein